MALMALISGSVFFFHRYNNLKIGNCSGVLTIESREVLIDGAMSVVVGLGLVILKAIPDGTFLTSEAFDIRLISDKVLIMILVFMMVFASFTIFKVQLNRLMGERVDYDWKKKTSDVLNK